MANEDSSFRSVADVESPASPDRDAAHRPWDEVGGRWAGQSPQSLWRAYSDRLQIGLFDRWGADVACGHGCPRPTLLKTDLFDEIAGRGIVHHCQSRGFRVSGIDISPVVTAAAGSRNPGLEVFVADVRRLPFDDGSFDVVFSGSTLDHFASADDIGLALGEINRVLRPGGRLVLTLDNPRNPLIWLRNGPLLRILRCWGIVPYPLGATLGPEVLAAVLRSTGLEVRRVSAILHSPRVLAVWMAGLLRGCGPATRARYLEALSRWERLEHWPTRWVTGYYTAILATKSRPEHATRGS